MLKRTCKDCGREFTLTDSEIKFYKDKNLELPKRCNDCRSKNKAKKAIENNESHRETDVDKSNNNKQGSTKTWRNVIIAALLIISSFFGVKLNFLSGSLNQNESNKSTVQQNYSLTFRNDELLKEHFKKHGNEFPYKSEEEYLEGAIAVVNSSSAKHKTEADDGDNIYYEESKNEIVFVSKDGYIRTYFKPSDGVKYYNRQ